MVGMVSSSSGRVGGAAVLGVVPGALDVFDAGADVHGRAVVRAGSAGVGGELGESVERQVDLAAGAFDAEVADRLRRSPRAGRAASSRRRKVSLGSRLEATVVASISSPPSSATPWARPSRTRILATGALVRISTPLARAADGDGLRDGAHAAAHEAPQAAVSGDAAHAVVQQDVGRARRARAAVGADHAVGGERDFDLLGFEPLVEELGGALREDLDQGDDVRARRGRACLPIRLQVLDQIAWRAAGRAAEW